MIEERVVRGGGVDLFGRDRVEVTWRAVDNSLGCKEIVQCRGFVQIRGEGVALGFESRDGGFVVAFEHTYG